MWSKYTTSHSRRSCSQGELDQDAVLWTRRIEKATKAATSPTTSPTRLTGRALDETLGTYQQLWNQVEAMEQEARAANKWRSGSLFDLLARKGLGWRTYGKGDPGVSSVSRWDRPLDGEEARRLGGWEAMQIMADGSWPKTRSRPECRLLGCREAG